MMCWKSGVALVVGVALLAGVLVFTNRAPVQAAAEQGSTASPRYTVVETQGHNLLVTDNGANKIYYYTIDKDKEIGSDLKLRGYVDLTQVGKDTIKITKSGK